MSLSTLGWAVDDREYLVATTVILVYVKRNSHHMIYLGNHWLVESFVFFPRQDSTETIYQLESGVTESDRCE
jgi:hypothetical protein